MSFLGGGSSGGGNQTQTTTTQPYAPAQPALNQIISEAEQYIIKDLEQQVMLHQLLKQHKVSHNKK